MRKHSPKTPRRKTRKKKLEPFFPKSRDKPRVDDRRVLRGIAHVQQVSCRWQDAPAVYGTHKTLYSRWNRWSKNGWFGETMEKLAIRGKKAHIIMIDSTCFKVHRTAASLKCYAGELGRFIDRTKGCQNTSLHAICEGNGRIFAVHLTDGRASDYKGAKVLLKSLPQWTERLTADRDWVRNMLESMGIEPCIPGRKNQVVAVKYDTEFYKERNKIECAFSRSRTGAEWQPAYDR